MTLRVAINKFATANKGYQGAKVYVFTVDDDFQKTNTKATLYDGPTGTGTLANPITLDSAGKFDTIPYVEVAVICTVNSMDFGEHDTGVVRIPGGWEGNWSPSTVYQADDLVKDGSAGGNTGNVYICLEPHTSGTSFTNDVDEGKWGLIFDLGTAAGFEAAAEASATAAAASAVTASGAASAASASAIAAAASADSIDDKYLGAKASAPTLDNDGDPLQAGMIYYNTTSGMMFVYDGSGWDATLALPTPLGVAAGGTGGTTESGARASLGVEIGVDVQGYSVNLATLSAVVPSSLGLDLLASANAAAAQTSLSLVPGTHVQAYDADLAAIAALATNGLIARTSAGAAAIRSIVAGAGISVTNGDGVAGNPTIAATGAALRNISGNDTLVRSDAGDTVRITANATIALDAAATLGAGWYCDVMIDGDYNDLRVVTFNPNGAEPIDEETTVNAYVGEFFRIYCDGTKFCTTRATEVYLGTFQAFSAATADWFTSGAFLDDAEFTFLRVLMDGLSHGNGVTRSIWMRFLDAAGNVLTTAGDYNIAQITNAASGSYAGTDASTATEINLTPAGSIAAAAVADAAMMEIWRSGALTSVRLMQLTAGATPNPMWITIDSAVGGLRWLLSGSGSLDAGNVQMWGTRARLP